ncbi:hypothetical protein [Shewanella violacea]|uniref:Uncharacterized protein n=1 Tax=Shewanella violacea (strain JCM 10179 / CIP 106290 / LMG 19151 / DSS12) TaxID=637905 RepID=D4ZCL4_SHEVD|nr:hypothetical protein [Shewanella violacea]BAJ03759.1 hypothetical protein SVI_3788 [Shewanella violacea DSS12]
MNNENQRSLYGDMGVLGGVLSALPIFLIALFTKLWLIGVLGIVFFILVFPFKEILFFSRSKFWFTNIVFSCSVNLFYLFFSRMAGLLGVSYILVFSIFLGRSILHSNQKIMNKGVREDKGSQPISLKLKSNSSNQSPNLAT